MTDDLKIYELNKKEIFVVTMSIILKGISIN